MGKRVYNIGYGGHPPSQFVGILKENRIRWVADVRSNPRRASMGCYVYSKDPKKGIVKLLSDAGIDYLWLQQLGNPEPKDPAMIQFRQLVPQFAQLSKQLVELASREAVCLMCAERKITDCHRELIVKYLRDEGWEVIDL